MPPIQVDPGPARPNTEVKASSVVSRVPAARNRLLFGVLLTATVFGPIISLMFGAAAVPFSEAFQIVFGKIVGDPLAGWDSSTLAIIWLNRVPRIITAYGVGIILGVSGVAM